MAILSIAICDDEQFALDREVDVVKTVLKEMCILHTIEIFNDPKALLTSEARYDAVFLDIDMPEITGFDVAEEVRKTKQNTIIIFITSHEDKVYQSWEFQPFWFVRKSHLEDLNIVLSKLLIKIESEREKEEHLFNLVGENQVVEIDINKVKYIEAYNHYIIIKDSDSGEIQTRCKISDAEQQLYPLYFVRIQNSVIVNCRFISKVTSRTVILHNGEKINISRDKVDYVKNEFQKFMRSR